MEDFWQLEQKTKSLGTPIWPGLGANENTCFVCFTSLESYGSWIYAIKFYNSTSRQNFLDSPEKILWYPLKDCFMLCLCLCIYIYQAKPPDSPAWYAWLWIGASLSLENKTFWSNLGNGNGILGWHQHRLDKNGVEPAQWHKCLSCCAQSLYQVDISPQRHNIVFSTNLSHPMSCLSSESKKISINTEFFLWIFHLPDIPTLLNRHHQHCQILRTFPRTEISNKLKSLIKPELLIVLEYSSTYITYRGGKISWSYKKWTNPWSALKTNSARVGL